MPASYPTSIPNLVNPSGTEQMNGANLHSLQHGNANDEIEAIATELGTNPSGNYTTVAERLGAELGFRNAIRNGDFSIWQRGGGSFNVNSSYTADGWSLHYATSAAAPYVVRWDGSTISDLKNFLIIVSQGQSAAGDYTILQHKIENVSRFAGKWVTLSFDTSCSAGSGNIAVELEQHFGTGGSPSALVRQFVGTMSVNGTMTRKEITFQVPSVSGKVVGTNLDDALTLNIWTSGGSTYNSRTGSIGLQNWNVNFFKMQLEEGKMATPFEVLPYQIQLAWCQRYFERVDYYGTQGSLGETGAYAPLETYRNIQFKVRKRAVPNMSVASWTNYDNGSRTSESFTGKTVDGFTYLCNPADTNYHYNTIAALFDASAEL